MKILYIFLLFNLNFVYSQNGPSDAIYPGQTIRHGYEALTSEYQYPIAWFQAATIDYNVNNDGYVKIDYFKFFELDENNNKKEVTHNDYNENQKQIDGSEGGLYSRNPVNKDFCSTKVSFMDNAYKDGSDLVVLAGKHGNLVSHWWSERIKGRIGSKYAVEVRFLVHGNIALQVGCDFYKTLTGEGGNMQPEPWVSDWFGDTKGEYRVETVPLYNINEKFVNGIDYGVTTSGKFFVSKNLYDHCKTNNVLQLLSDYGENHWGGTPMNFDGENWTYESHKKLSKNTKIKFCFRVSADHYLPHMIVYDGTIQNKDDAMPNEDKGYNFYIYPIDE